MQVLGIVVAILGAIVIAAPDLRGGFSRGNAPLLGNLLATSAAITAAIYYTTAFVALAAIGLLLGVRLFPQPPREIAIFAGLALGPMLLGHTGMNWALKFLPAYVVNLTVLGEPVGATLLGALIPSIRQIPSSSTMIGGAIVLGGVIIAANNAAVAATK